MYNQQGTQKQLTKSLQVDGKVFLPRAKGNSPPLQHKKKSVDFKLTYSGGLWDMVGAIQANPSFV